MVDQPSPQTNQRNTDAMVVAPTTACSNLAQLRENGRYE
jgi:hypothetical protein